MNDSINYRNFIDMLVNSEDEYEPYGFIPNPISPAPVSSPASYVMSDETEEYETWYGE